MKPRAISLFSACLGCVALLASPFAAAQSAAPPPDAPSRAPASGTPDVTAPSTILIRSDTATLTRADYDLELSRLPPDTRGGFAVDPARVNALLNRMLAGRTMAAWARKAGIDKVPETQQRIALETDRLLATLYVEKIEADATREFDALPGMETAARERYLADAAKYRTPEAVSVTHILFDVTTRTKEEALKLARDARAKILAGADMNELAREISDDRSAARNGGRIENFTRERMDPAFATTAFALATPGDLSEPVLSQFGYHLIRLDGKTASVQRQFSEVKNQILADMRRQYVDKRRGEIIASISNDSTIVVNDPAVEALLTQFDQDAMRKAMAQGLAAKPSALPAAPAKPAPK